MNYIFGANKVALVDKIGKTSIFRGARPLAGTGVFAYHELRDRLIDFGLDLYSSLLQEYLKKKAQSFRFGMNFSIIFIILLYKINNCELHN